ncbi:hypothetical protein BDV25DRAFT_137580 [Aspergillus avenaceus]|uniref:Protein kinase domain-containing protein n=1 Tax=Aspergillus avenaceus TaxID=36643 RepID=A0A5N6U2B5_ASPAV|nr:hypothetical protein BDV25DRAFT_137580 [Aspergillus avenaceus]
MSEGIVIDEFPHYRIVDFYINDAAANLTIMCGGNLFKVDVQAIDLKDTEFETGYQYWLEMLTTLSLCIYPKPNTVERQAMVLEFSKWLLRPCLSFVEQEAQDMKNKSISLEDYAFPTAWSLKLMAFNDCMFFLRPEKIFDCALRTVSVPLTGIRTAVRRIRATTVFSEGLDGDRDPGCDIPRHVKFGQFDLFFKPVKTPQGFKREVTLLHDIQTFNLPVRVPKLHSIVLSEAGDKALGILLQWLPFGSNTLLSQKGEEAKRLHDKWESQVGEILEHLHQKSIIWGDVSPSNIVIDWNDDAWILDFAGGVDEDFVDKQLAGTPGGDLGGIEKVFRSWLPDRFS